MDSDLDKLIHSSRHLINEQQARSFITQVLLGLLYLHSAHILHRDLKPGNVFVLLGQGLAKIGDFGLSRGICLNHLTGDATHPHDEQLTEYVVTRWYRAPEVLLARSQYGPAIDVWSVGCILFEMWTRQALFPGKNSYDQLQRVMDVIGPIPLSECAWVPRQSRALLDRCNQGSSG